MIYKLKRNGKLIGEVIPIDTPPLYAGSILIHELVVCTQLYDGEALAVSYSTAAGVAITKSQMMFSRASPDGGREYYAPLPNKVVKAGDKAASIFILDLYAPTVNESGSGYRMITSADIPFTVYPSNAYTDFEPVEESLTVRIQQRVDALTQQPDCTEAGNVGTPSVTVKADGSFKFSNLKGEPGHDGRDGRDGIDGKDGKNGVNGTTQWGIDGPSPISTLQIKEI